MEHTTVLDHDETFASELLGGRVVVRTDTADPDNGWDASVVLCAGGLDARSYWTPADARHLAAELNAAADHIAPEPVDLTAVLRAIAVGNASVIRVDTTAAQSADDTETLVLEVAGQQFTVTDSDLLNLFGEVGVFVHGLDVDIVEARQIAVEAQQHLSSCGLRLDADEECGCKLCAAYAEAEHRDMAVI